MSRIPSNTEQFLSGIAAGTQNIGQATQNFAATEQAAQGRMGLQLEGEKLRQQGQQFQQGLQAEAENYRKLNESRERMQTQELAQQGSQFQQRMQFDQEQARIERTLAVRLKQHEMEMMATDREIAATASNDPRIRELRAKRADLRKRARDVEMMMGSAGMAQQMAQGVRGERLNEAQTRLTAMQQGVQTRAENALNAVTQGFDYSVLKDSAEGGFIQGMARAAAADAGGIFGSTPAAMAVKTLWEEMKMWALGTGAGDEAFAEAKATEFLNNGGAMAAATLANALSLNKVAFGLKDGEREKAIALVNKIVADGAILANVDPRAAAGGAEGQKAHRERIAKSIGELRKTGMGDEQISALFDGLDSVSGNRDMLLAQYTEREGVGTQPQILDRTLEGVGRISDMVQGVMDDVELMNPVGGSVKDPSKYDWIGTLRKAQAAYGMGQSSDRIQELQRAMTDFGIPENEILGLVETLTASDPNLQYLRPEEYLEVIRGLQAQGYNLEDVALQLDETLGQTQAEVVAGRQGQMFRQGSAGFDDLLSEVLR
jgi:hypothetical protein